MQALKSLSFGETARLHGSNGRLPKIAKSSRSCSRAVLKEQFRVQSTGVTTEPTGRSFLSAEQKVFEVVAKQAAMVDEQQRRTGIIPQDVRPDLAAGSAAELLDEAYVRCGEVCAEYAKTFYLGTKILSIETLVH